MKDLTKIKAPFGLLKPKVQKALRAHGGPYEVYIYRGWQSTETPFTDEALSYRVKPADPITLTTVVGSIPDSACVLQAAGDAKKSPALSLPYRELFEAITTRFVCTPADHPIFAAVKEWQEARDAYENRYAGSAGRLDDAQDAIMAIKVPE